MSRLPATELGELEAFRSLLAGQPGGHTHELAGALCTALERTPSSALFNRVLGLGIREPVTEATLDEIAAFYGSLGVAYAVTVTADAAPSDLPELLARRGFTRGYAWTKFRRGPEPAPSAADGPRIERIGPEHGVAFAEIFARAYAAPPAIHPLVARLPGLDGWQCFLAFAGAAPAATAALYVVGDVGWLGVAGTLPDLRGRGAQTALLRGRIDAARELGCTVLVTETGEPVGGRPGASYRNIRRAGFEPAYVRQNYLSDANADTSGTLA